MGSIVSTDIAVLDIGKTSLKLLVASEEGWPLEAHAIAKGVILDVVLHEPRDEIAVLVDCLGGRGDAVSAGDRTAL